MNRLTIIACLALAGCATCREYPTACKAVAAAVVIGAAIAIDHHQGAHPTPCEAYYEARGASPADAAHDCR